jgi:hypothetical protein
MNLFKVIDVTFKITVVASLAAKAALVAVVLKKASDEIANQEEVQA